MLFLAVCESESFETANFKVTQGHGVTDTGAIR